MPARRARRISNSGFTLVELAVVVVIVGVLAVLAVVGYRQYTLNAKITEAQAMISAIRIAQEDRRAEAGTYADLGVAYCPSGSAGTSDKKWGWKPACSGGSGTWETLAVHNDGPVQFGYATVAGTGTTISVPTDAAFVTFPAAVTAPWYIIIAKADLNPGNSYDTTLVGTSFSNQIYQQYPGQ